MKKIFLYLWDRLADIDINQLNDFHKKNNLIATVTAVVPQTDMVLYQSIQIVEDFEEKPKATVR